MPPNKKNKFGGWTDLVGVVKTPLGFYVLSLLIVESTLAIVLTRSNLSEAHVWAGFKWMIAILGAVLGIVTAFAFWKPKNLLYGKEDHHQEVLEALALRDQIEDLIYANVKPESLKKK